MRFLVLTRVNIRINNLFQIPTIDLVSIQPSKNLCKTYNAQVIPKRSKTIHLSQAAK